VAGLVTLEVAYLLIDMVMLLVLRMQTRRLDLLMLLHWPVGDATCLPAQSEWRLLHHGAVPDELQHATVALASPCGQVSSVAWHCPAPLLAGGSGNCVWELQDTDLARTILDTCQACGRQRLRGSIGSEVVLPSCCGLYRRAECTLGQQAVDECTRFTCKAYVMHAWQLVLLWHAQSVY
jgi:hypothetical protein